MTKQRLPARYAHGKSGSSVPTNCHTHTNIHCSLCLTCTYQITSPSVVASSPEANPASHVGFGILTNAVALTPSHIKPTLIQLLSNSQPNDVASTYLSIIKPWFHIISDDVLSRRLPSTWDEATVDFTLLSLTIVVLSSVPERHIIDGNAPPNLTSLYLSTKACIALVEGAGINSLEMAQSKLFTALFEVGHGFYPAAYTSIGAAVRAIEALIICNEADASMTQSPVAEERQGELMMAWRGVLIVDRLVVKWITIRIFNGKSFGYALPPTD